jgi:ribosomal protein S6E (S10)
VFIQVIQGRTTSQDQARELGDRWMRDLAPGAVGWLGSTFGITDDGTMLGVIRFESREAAQANADRPEQTAFAEEMAKLFDGPPEFHDCDDVTLMMQGGSDEAGFVQVMRGKVADAESLKSLMTDSDRLHEARPEIIGATLAIDEEGNAFETVAFTDEAAARRGEQQEMPDDVRKTLEAAVHDVSFYDLHEPWFASKA